MSSHPGRGTLGEGSAEAILSTSLIHREGDRRSVWAHDGDVGGRKGLAQSGRAVVLGDERLDGCEESFGKRAFVLACLVGEVGRDQRRDGRVRDGVGQEQRANVLSNHPRQVSFA